MLPENMSNHARLSECNSGLHRFGGDPRRMQLRLVLTDVASLLTPPISDNSHRPQCHSTQMTNTDIESTYEARYLLKRSTDDPASGWTIQPDAVVSSQRATSSRLANLLKLHGFELRVKSEPASRMCCSRYKCIAGADDGIFNGFCRSSNDAANQRGGSCDNNANYNANNNNHNSFGSQSISTARSTEPPRAPVNHGGRQKAEFLMTPNKARDFQQIPPVRAMSGFLLERKRASNWKDTTIVTSDTHVADYLKRANARKLTTATSCNTSAESATWNPQDSIHFAGLTIGPLFSPCRCSNRTHSLIETDCIKECRSSCLCPIGCRVCSSRDDESNSPIDRIKISQPLISECHGAHIINSSSSTIRSCLCRCSELSNHYRQSQVLNLLRPLSSSASNAIRFGQLARNQDEAPIGHTEHHSSCNSNQTATRDHGFRDTLLNLLDSDNGQHELIKLSGAELAEKLAESIEKVDLDSPLSSPANLHNAPATLIRKQIEGPNDCSKNLDGIESYNDADSGAAGQDSSSQNTLHGEIIFIMLEKYARDARSLCDSEGDRVSSMVQDNVVGERIADNSKTRAHARSMASTLPDSGTCGDSHRSDNRDPDYESSSEHPNLTLDCTDGHLLSASADDSGTKSMNADQGLAVGGGRTVGVENTNSTIRNATKDCLSESKSQQRCELIESDKDNDIVIAENNHTSNYGQESPLNKLSDDSTSAHVSRFKTTNTTTTAKKSIRPEVGPFDLLGEPTDNAAELTQTKTLEYSICLSVIVIDVFNKLIQLKPDLNQSIVVDLGTSMTGCRAVEVTPVASVLSADTVEPSSNRAHDIRTSVSDNSWTNGDDAWHQREQLSGGGGRVGAHPRIDEHLTGPLKFNYPIDCRFASKLFCRIELGQGSSDQVTADQELDSIRSKFGLMQRLWKPVRELDLNAARRHPDRSVLLASNGIQRPDLMINSAASCPPAGFMGPINGNVLIKLQFDIQFASEFTTKCQKLYVKYKLLAPESSIWKLRRLHEIDASTGHQTKQRILPAGALDLHLHAANNGHSGSLTSGLGTGSKSAKLEHVTHVPLSHNNSRTMSNMNQDHSYDEMMRDQVACNAGNSSTSHGLNDDKSDGGKECEQNLLLEGSTITSQPDSSGRFHFACVEQVVFELSRISTATRFNSTIDNENNAKSGDRMLLLFDKQHRNSSKSRASIRRQKSFQPLGTDYGLKRGEMSDEIDDGPISAGLMTQSAAQKLATTTTETEADGVESSVAPDYNDDDDSTTKLTPGMSKINHSSFDSSDKNTADSSVLRAYGDDGHGLLGENKNNNKFDDENGKLHEDPRTSCGENNPNKSDNNDNLAGNATNNVAPTAPVSDDLNEAYKIRTVSSDGFSPISETNYGNNNNNNNNTDKKSQLSSGAAPRTSTSCNYNKSNINKLNQQDAIYEIILLLEVYSSNFYLDKFQGWSYLSIPINLAGSSSDSKKAITHTVVNRQAARPDGDTSAASHRGCSRTRQELTVLRPALGRNLDKLRYHLTGKLPDWMPSPENLVRINRRYLLQTEQNGKIYLNYEITSQNSDPEFDLALRHLLAETRATVLPEPLDRLQVNTSRPHGADHKKGQATGRRSCQADRLASSDDAGQPWQANVQDIVEEYWRARSRTQRLDVSSLLQVG